MESAHFTQEQLTERFDFARKYKNIVFGLIGVGLVLLVAGGIFSSDSSHVEEDDHATTEQVTNIHPVADPPPADDDHGHGHGFREIGTGTRMLSNFLLCSLYFLSIAMGAMFFLTVHQVGNAGWHTAVRRISEAMTMYLPVAAIGFVALFFFLDHIYDWAATPEGYDELIDKKRAFLNQPGFIIRNVIYFAVWIATAIGLRRLSVRQDNEGLAEDGGRAFIKRGTTISAIYIFFFAFSYSLFAIDWIKSLEPHWFSTMFGVYFFGASFKASLFTLGLLLFFLKSQGYMKFTNDAHYHDIFKYAFGFTVFWGYIFVAQYLLIWYADIPEEGVYYAARYLPDSGIYVGGYFNVLFFLNIFLCFAIPFFGLMTRDAKRMPKIFVPIAIIALLGHWLDLYVLIMPGAVNTSWDLGLIEMGFFMTFTGIFLYVVFNALTRAGLAPVHHPYLEESLHHTTGPV